MIIKFILQNICMHISAIDNWFRCVHVHTFSASYCDKQFHFVQANMVRHSKCLLRAICSKETTLGGYFERYHFIFFTAETGPKPAIIISFIISDSILFNLIFYQ